MKKKVLGGVLISTPFVAWYVLAVLTAGWVSATLMIAAVAMLIGAVSLGVWLWLQGEHK